MEQNPNAVFCEKELSSLFPGAVLEARQRRLLRQSGVVADGGYCDLGAGGPRVVVADRGELEAIDDDDEETDPVRLAPEDLTRYALDLEAFAATVQQSNQLTGKAARLTDRLYFLGEAKPEGILVAYVLAFINVSPATRNILLALPSLLPNRYNSTLVVCPSYQPDPVERKHLEGMHIQVALLGSDNPLVLPRFESSEGNGLSGFQHSEDYRSVAWRGQTFPFAPRQADVVRILHQAQRTGSPGLSWEQICKRVPDHPQRMRDIFRRSPAWGSLIIEVTRGVYRLDI